VSRRRVILVLFGFALSVQPVAGQVTTLNNLTFGTITSGTTTHVAYTSPSAAEWQIHPTLGLTGTFQFTLPTTLSGPGATLSITYSSTDGHWRANTNNPSSGGTTFDPHNTQSIALVLSQNVFVWLGASVSPPLNQKPGTYTGTVVLTVTGLL
jgi:hypothetical protein